MHRYSQSKWVAEQLVLRARTQGLPVVIYRLGNLAGDQKNFQWNPLDFTLLVFKGVTETLTAPIVDWQVEMNPVDFASEMIVKMTQEMSTTLGKVYHIVNPQPLNAKWLFEWMRTFGYPLEMVSFPEWRKAIETYSTGNPKSGLAPLQRLLDIWMTDSSFLSNLSTYTTTNFKGVMERFKVGFPVFNGELLSSYFSSLAAQCVLPRIKIRLKGPRPLQDKVVIVTGASSGIGEAVSRALAENGAKVVLAARRKERLDKIRDDITELGDVAISVETDVITIEQVVDLVSHTKDTLGPVDVLINCAGLGFYTTMKNCNLEEWEKMVDVNCKGVMNCIGAVLPGMLERKRGHIVNISSNAGRKSFPGLAVYAATKFFVEALTQSLRLETVGSGVKVTSIQPGDVATEFGFQSSDEEAREKYEVSDDVKRLDPCDVANAVIYAVTQPAHCSVNEILVEPTDAPC